MLAPDIKLLRVVLELELRARLQGGPREPWGSGRSLGVENMKVEQVLGGSHQRSLWARER
jgi:hypothetical protein